MNTRHIFAIGAALMLAAGTVFPQSGPPSPGDGGEGGTNTVDPAVIEAQRQAAYTNKFKQWVVGSESLLTVQNFSTTSGLQLYSISTNMVSIYAAQKAAVTNYVATNGFGLQESWTNEAGAFSVIDGIRNGRPRIKSTFNLSSARSVSVTNLWPSGPSGMGLTGTNVSGGVWDGGDVLTNHVEFSLNGLRVIDIDGPSSYGVVDHATHVSGTMAGYGQNPFAIGMSHRMTLYASDFINDLAEIPGAVVTNALPFSNHSYGYKGGWVVAWNGFGYAWYWFGDMALNASEDWTFGFYDDEAYTIDATAYASRHYLPVWAAGNELGERGPETQPIAHYALYNGAFYYTTAVHDLDGGTTGLDTLTSYCTAKNPLVVGAIYKNEAGYSTTNIPTIAPFSSRGPTDDGRIKPDVVAPGVDLYSAVAAGPTSYGGFSGTSMAAPVTSGSLGLLTELHNRYYTNQPMLSSTMKAIVINTADEAGGSPGPDYTFGWGVINAAKAAILITNNHSSTGLAHIKEIRLSSGDYVEFPITATNTQPLRVTMAWTDPAGAVLSPALNPTNRMLKNDLDLRLILPGVSTNQPWKLDRSSPTSPATTGDNLVDNVEQIDIAAPSNAVYLVRVTHKGGLVNETGATNDQRLSLVIRGNVPQTAIMPQFSDVAFTSSNRVSFLWNSEAGRIYLLQYRDNVATGLWQNASGEISASKTNTAYDVTLTGTPTNRFYRLIQTR